MPMCAQLQKLKTMIFVVVHVGCENSYFSKRNLYPSSTPSIIVSISIAHWINELAQLIQAPPAKKYIASRHLNTSRRTKIIGFLARKSIKRRLAS